ncbi:hypothetical protein [Phytohalomonas tamaricis]|uniref:hypothetical protein n=1 Tax=Phytohalomonas tamaricis TaxID=2081032 RepID=UPI000D0B4640|nr:hypothetical protein [Phytohalomonas tamaricis]
MGKAGLYNEEKVLYFANQKQGLHVSITEPEHSDLTEIVESLKEQQMIKRVEHDDSGFYYHTTTAGERRLIHLQIKWRKRNGKSVKEHKKRLSELDE